MPYDNFVIAAVHYPVGTSFNVNTKQCFWNGTSCNYVYTPMTQVSSFSQVMASTDGKQWFFDAATRHLVVKLLPDPWTCSGPTGCGDNDYFSRQGVKIWNIRHRGWGVSISASNCGGSSQACGMDANWAHWTPTYTVTPPPTTPSPTTYWSISQAPTPPCPVICGSAEYDKPPVCISNGVIVADSVCDPTSKPMSQQLVTCSQLPCPGDQVYGGPSNCQSGAWEEFEYYFQGNPIPSGHGDCVCTGDQHCNYDEWCCLHFWCSGDYGRCQPALDLGESCVSTVGNCGKGMDCSESCLVCVGETGLVEKGGFCTAGDQCASGTCSVEGDCNGGVCGPFTLEPVSLPCGKLPAVSTFEASGMMTAPPGGGGAAGALPSKLTLVELFREVHEPDSSEHVEDLDLDAYTLTSDAPESFPVGETTVTLTVSKAFSTTLKSKFGSTTTTTVKEASGTVRVRVQDTTAPSMSCTADLTIEANTGVVVAPPVVTDAADPNPVVTSNAPRSYPVGTTRVTWKATDASGNSNFCSTDVRVTAAPTPAPTSAPIKVISKGRPGRF